jgi:hypothetical protein
VVVGLAGFLGAEAYKKVFVFIYEKQKDYQGFSIGQIVEV